jgi:anhydro-N-acetylmuramic acid kinase
VGSEFFIGLLSGTSRDGVDIALVDFEDGRPDILMARCLPYSPNLRAAIDRLIETGPPTDAALGPVDRELGQFFALAVRNLVRDAGLDPRDIRAVGSHGQTVWHAPTAKPPRTIQLGDGALIARLTGIPTVSDFRSPDLRAGGQGAPLAPLLHRALFLDDRERRAVLNLGGIANLTLLRAGEPLTGFDTGPANCLMDLWIHRHRGADFDANGAWAAGGEIHGALLGRLLDEPFFRAEPPKSTGLELFNAAWLEGRLEGLELRPRDVQRTLAELSAQTIADQLRLAGGADRVLVCGGGVHNQFLLSRLELLLGRARVESTAVHGIHPDWVEACLFAWLARERLRERQQETGPITGARRPVLLGSVNPADGQATV